MIQILSFDIGIKNLAICINHFNDKLKTMEIKVWRIVDLNCRKSDGMGLVSSLIEMLDKLVEEEFVFDMDTYVIIENQMIASMKCLQTAINVYFQIMSKHVLGIPIKVEYINPRMKLKLVEYFEGYKRDNVKCATKYKQNKVDSVDLAKWLLANIYNDTASFEFLCSNSKKDDLADSYNQAVGWALLAYKSI